MMAAVVLVVGCSKDTSELPQAAEAEPQVASKPTPVSPVNDKLIADAIVEKAVRISLNKPEGELTEADLVKIQLLPLGLTKITDKGLKEVAKLQNLSHLVMHGTPITGAGLKELAKLEKLTSLMLQDTKITDAGLKDLAKLQKLKFLGLHFTEITDEGYKELTKLPNLLGLGLVGSKGTRVGVLRLRKALPNTNISMP